MGRRLLKDTDEYAVSQNTVLVRPFSGVVNPQAPSRKQKRPSPVHGRSCSLHVDDQAGAPAASHSQEIRKAAVTLTRGTALTGPGAPSRIGWP